MTVPHLKSTAWAAQVRIPELTLECSGLIKRAGVCRHISATGAHKGTSADCQNHHIFTSKIFEKQIAWWGEWRNNIVCFPQVDTLSTVTMTPKCSAGIGSGRRWFLLKKEWQDWISRSRAGIVCRASAWSHTVMIGPSFEPHQCLLTGVWKRTAWLSWWLPRGWQVLHQRWILGNVYASTKCE